MNTAQGLRFSARIGDLPDDVFDVVGFELEESLSSPFRLQLRLCTRDTPPEPGDLLEQPALLSIEQYGETTRHVQGIVTDVARHRMGPSHHSLSLEIGPALVRLSHMHNLRIFQNQNVPDIISTLLEERGIHDFRMALRDPHPKREYCVQYRETDLAFVQRLAAEEGISYRFEFGEEPALVFEDDLRNAPSLGTLTYEPSGGGDHHEPSITRFAQARNLITAETRLQDYDFQRPEHALSHCHQSNQTEAQRSDYQHYDFPGRYRDEDTGQRLSRYRQQALERDAQQARGDSDAAILTPGAAVTLDNDLLQSTETEWRVTSVRHFGEQPQALQENAGSAPAHYSNRFTAVPAATPWRPEPLATPFIGGPQSAFVTGPEGEEIHCDEHGRVRLRFPWDRSGTPDENSSAWVRVAHGWAGAGHGRLALPRVGEEVLVTFMDGDPDQPLVTGRVHHAQNVAPLNLPEEKTRTVWRTHTHQGEGANELSFDDRADNERIELQAAGNLHSAVRNDRIESIGNDSHLQVDGNQYRQTQGDHHQVTDGDQLASVGGDTSLSVQGSIHLKAGNAWLSDAGTELHIKAGQKAVIEAGTELTLDAGGSFLKLDPSGVTLMGPTIKLNAGGAPGAGSGQQAEAAEAPMQLDSKKLEQAEPAELPQQQPRPVFTAAAARSLQLAGENRSGIVEECQRQEDGSCPLDDCPCGRQEGATA